MNLPARIVARPARLVSVLTLCLVSFASTAQAAKVYRCGNVFQDQPCPETKVAVVTPSDRPVAIARESPCTTRDANGRNDCVVKTAAPRDVANDPRR